MYLYRFYIRSIVFENPLVGVHEGVNIDLLAGQVHTAINGIHLLAHLVGKENFALRRRFWKTSSRNIILFLFP